MIASRQLICLLKPVLIADRIPFRRTRRVLALGATRRRKFPKSEKYADMRGQYTYFETTK